MIDPRFVYLAVSLSALGAWGYVRDTWRGVTAPNRVTWTLWGIGGVLSAIVEFQQHVGIAALMTAMLGFGPFVVVAVSFKNPHAVWRLGPFDVACGVSSAVGIVVWALIDQPTVALVAFVIADQLAALPTLRKSWLAPETETSWVFALGSANCVITVMTLPEITTAGALFPGFVAITDALIALLVATRVGPRLRARVGVVA